MAGESDEPDDAAARLEAALERIAVAVARRPSAEPEVSVAPPPVELSAAIDPAIVARLDGLIKRLRGALAVRPG